MIAGRDPKGGDSKRRIIFRETIPFVTARRKANGGFGATPRLPATIEDTYHALNILGLARRYYAVTESEFNSIVDENLSSYLAACRQNLPAGVRTTFQLFWCCRFVGQKFDPHAIETTVLAKMAVSDFLADWYYGARIFGEVEDGRFRKLADAPHFASILDNRYRTVKEVWQHMYLFRKFRHTLPQPAPELIAWFRASQNSDGGFGFLPGTTSFVENCHSCLRALASLDAKPRDPDRAFRFLSGCQTISGGFGRNSHAAPFLDISWHALAALALTG
jgi:prenyltransferase beta subunit